MVRGSAVYFRGGIVYLATTYFNLSLGSVEGQPIFTFSPTIQALSAYLPAALRASAFEDENFIQKLRDTKPAPLPKAAKVRSWKRFEAGTSTCFVFRNDENCSVEWLFPYKRPGSGFIGKKEAPRSVFSLDDDLAMICAAMLTHLTNPANRYAEIA